MKKKAQISLEFLLIIGVAIVLIFPATLLFMNFVRTSSTEITSIQVQHIGDIITKNARFIYYYGDDAFIELEIDFPDKITNMSMYENQLYIEASTSHGSSTSYFKLDVNTVNKTFEPDDFTKGIKHFRIINMNNTIDIIRIRK